MKLTFCLFTYANAIASTENSIVSADNSIVLIYVNKLASLA
ncbi:hypothetical protein GXM_06174 [Nostoc sphaeroides CCNUC1]|uniref:Uncharacterized protein n=1 Tax=Nostoc sphaeroides CCNUC1 TaxID=2653204 RepID=A0A5P8W7Q0_9NOSO|nr:hypothetical protein GXM_06174 [Nostoc sphaeroides CCNUC1]